MSRVARCAAGCRRTAVGLAWHTIGIYVMAVELALKMQGVQDNPSQGSSPRLLNKIQNVLGFSKERLKKNSLDSHQFWA